MKDSAQESAQQILAQAYEREQREQREQSEKREVRRRLGDRLRGAYDETVRAPLPSDWLRLIDSLRSRLSPPK